MERYLSDDGKIEVNVNIGYLSEGRLLEGKNIFILGASGGIGQSIARACIGQEASVVLAGRNIENLENLSNELGCKARHIKADLTNVSSFAKIIEQADSFFGNLDCVVMAAGISLHEPQMEKVDEKSWDIQFDTNIKGPYFFIQQWVNYYREKRINNGRIVFLASDTSGMGSSIPYGLTKSAVSSLTFGLAKKLITEGIRVNAIAPGTTLTDMTDDFTRGYVGRHTTQGKRVFFPEEIAQVCVFLLSDMSACISGNIIGCTESNICFDNISKEFETNP